MSLLAALASCVLPAGCEEFFTRQADRDVYSLIEKRQQQALGTTTDVCISGPAARGTEPNARPGDTEPYAFAPHPLPDTLPEAFARPPVATLDTPGGEAAARRAGRTASPSVSRATQPADVADPSGGPGLTTRPATATAPAREELTLEQVLAYAFGHSRDFQTAKEQLYLAALDLTLERHLWTPQFFGEASTLYGILPVLGTNQRGDLTLESDNTLRSVASVGARQKLPYGGEVVAQVINSLVRDVDDHLTSGENGQTVLSANLPLLRGAGRSALETRYQAERDLIYAIRTFEGFRRNLVVQIAADYFSLQNLRQQINNTEQSIQSFEILANQTRALWEKQRRILLDVQRADQEWLVATNDRIDAVTTYQTALDAFKLRIGMPIETPIDVTLPSEPGASNTDAKSEDSLVQALRMPAVTEDEAIAAGLKYRLDLLNDFDRIGDADRGVNIARNNLLPDLNATSSVQFNTHPEHASVATYNAHFTNYQAGLALELPLDRVAERNALRRSQVAKNAAERTYEEARYTVMLQVRSAMRRVEQQRLSLQIQTTNREVALQRRELARFQLDRGLIGNRDFVEAENALLQARNRLAAAQADLSLAILQFRRDTGTLRVGDDGKWANDAPLSGAQSATPEASTPTSQPAAEAFSGQPQKEHAYAPS